MLFMCFYEDDFDDNGLRIYRNEEPGRGSIMGLHYDRTAAEDFRVKTEENDIFKGDKNVFSTCSKNESRFRAHLNQRYDDA